ncbi:MAG: hypothetical protein ABMB14_10075 [Myxococcota bacterium]
MSDARSTVGRLARLGVCAGVIGVLTSCVWTAPADDGGDETFIRQVVPALLGRKVRGSEEIRFLADLAALHGRAAVVDLLLAQPEYVAYWTQVLADDLTVERAGAGWMNADCFGSPLLIDSVGGALLDHVGYGDPTQPFCYDPQDPDTWSRSAPPKPADGADAADAADSADADAAVDDPFAAFDFVPDDGGSAPGPTGAPADDAAEAVVWPDDAGTTDAPAGDDPTARTTGLVCPPFRMTDLLRQAVRLDDLFPLYRGWLAPLETYGFGTGETNRRNQVAAKFFDVYLDRDPECLACHTTNYSRTNARSSTGWDRFEVLDYDLEGGAFAWRLGNKRVYGGDGGGTIHANVRNYFRSDVLTTNTTSALRPFGFTASCVAANGTAGFVGSVPSGSGGDFAGLGGVSRSSGASVYDLMSILSQGRLDLPATTGIDPGWGAIASANAAYYSCPGCHPANGVDLTRVVPQMGNNRLFRIIRYGTGAMPAQQSTDLGALVALRAVRAVQGSAAVPLAQSDKAAVAALLATNITNEVVEEVMGERLVLAHGFPRNVDQRDTLEHLTAVFAADWSLADLLREIVLSEAFGRRAPEVATVDYALPRLPNPFSLQGPTDTAPAATHNSVGDFVHRYSIPSLLVAVDQALGWPGPQIVGNGSVFPRQRDLANAGRYESVLRPGTDTVDFAGLTAWEELAGTCRKPASVAVASVEPDPAHPTSGPYTSNENQWIDWIDVASAEGHGETIEAVVTALKDRLLGDPTLEPDEAALIEQVFAGSSLSGTYKSTMEDQLRLVCSAMLKSPQFVLGGIEHAPPIPDQPPAFLPCLDDRCTYQQLCDLYRGTLGQLGTPFDCGPVSGGGIDDPH